MHNDTDLPQIDLTTYASNNCSAYFAGNLGGLDGSLVGHTVDSVRRLQSFHANQPAYQQPTTQVVEPMNQKRIVQVFIADPDKRVPVEESLLYRGEQKLTDLTDQELFFEIDVKGSLDKHNEKRVKLVDKEASQRAGKDVLLEPVKIRDLKMTVVVVATF